MSCFTNDINILDMTLPMIACDSVEAPLYFLNLLIVICIRVPWFSICMPFLLIFIIITYKLCVEIMHKTKALDLKTKTPIINCFNILIKGKL